MAVVVVEQHGKGGGLENSRVSLCRLAKKPKVETHRMVTDFGSGSKRQPNLSSESKCPSRRRSGGLPSTKGASANPSGPFTSSRGQIRLRAITHAHSTRSQMGGGHPWLGVRQCDRFGGQADSSRSEEGRGKLWGHMATLRCFRFGSGVSTSMMKPVGGMGRSLQR